MAASFSVVAPRIGTLRASPAAKPHDVLYGALLATLLAPFALILGGYHPFAEDGGLYLAGVRYLLDPTLYPASSPFVTAHLHYSLFAPALASAVRHTGLSLEVVVLIAHLLCIWATLFAAYLLAVALFPASPDTSRSRVRSSKSSWRPSSAPAHQHAGAVLLLAAWLGLPVAGTSLTVADPYLTARSLSTPCVLLALAAALRARSLVGARAPALRITLAIAACLLALTVGVLFHPLMAGYGAVCVATLLVLETRATLASRLSGLVLAAILVAAIVARLGQTETTASRAAALTRTYWFVSQWRWYELLGLIAPLALLAAVATLSNIPAVRALARAAIVAGLLSILVAVLFVHPSTRSFAVGRLQPLRLFQVLYLIMIVLLGAALGSLLKARPERWAAALALLAAVMLPTARAAFPASRWLELPTGSQASRKQNPWSAAFLWCREHTPKDAIFALDADYIAQPGEDAQSFRALAERSSLADQAKDGGEAAITPALSGVWQRDVRAQRALSSLSDRTRHDRLQPLGVTWLVLESRAPTLTPCPFNNETVKVCPLR